MWSAEEKRMIGGNGTVKNAKDIEKGMKNGDPRLFFWVVC